MLTAELINPNVYDPDALSAVNWLHEHLPLSDKPMAQLIGASPELFSQWKTGEQTLTTSQTQTLESLSIAINRLLSFLIFAAI